MVIFWVKTNKTKKTPSQHSLTTITKENYTSRTYFSQKHEKRKKQRPNKRQAKVCRKTQIAWSHKPARSQASTQPPSGPTVPTASTPATPPSSTSAREPADVEMLTSGTSRAETAPDVSTAAADPHTTLNSPMQVEMHSPSASSGAAVAKVSPDVSMTRTQPFASSAPSAASAAPTEEKLQDRGKLRIRLHDWVNMKLWNDNWRTTLTLDMLHLVPAVFYM